MNEKTIDLNHIEQYCTLTSAWCSYLSEGACVCLEKFGHQPGVKLMVECDFEASFVLNWKKLPPTTIDSWEDLEKAVEFAAYAIALILVWQLTSYKIVRQARRGTKIDYWLGEKSAQNPAQTKGKLEVSGILKGSIGQMNFRVKEKSERAKSAKDKKLTFIVVAEFSRPLVKMIQQ